MTCKTWVQGSKLSLLFFWMEVSDQRVQITRVALLTWSLITGTALWTKRAMKTMVSHIKRLLLDREDLSWDYSHRVLMWVLSLGGISAETTANEEWFVMGMNTSHEAFLALLQQLETYAHRVQNSKRMAVFGVSPLTSTGLYRIALFNAGPIQSWIDLNCSASINCIVLLQRITPHPSFVSVTRFCRSMTLFLFEKAVRAGK